MNIFRIFPSNGSSKFNVSSIHQQLQKMNKNIELLETKFEDLQIQYNVEILNTILQYKRAPK
jgi:TolA-binding protein